MDQRQKTWCSPELDRQTNTLDLLRRQHTADSVGTRQMSQGGFSDYLLIFSRSSGTNKVRYMVLDPPVGGAHCRPLAKVSTVLMTKIQDVIGYRVVVLDNYLYVLGGRHYQSGAYLKHCYKFDPRNNQWLRIARMIKARTRFTATALGDCIYVCGEFYVSSSDTNGHLSYNLTVPTDDTIRGGEGRGGRAMDGVECYDPLTDTWTEMRPMPESRADHAACVAEGRLFISGGVGDSQRPTNNFWQYEPLSDFWSQSSGKSMLPRGRQRHMMVEHKGKVFCLGGISTVRKDRTYVDEEEASVVSFDCSKGNIDSKITGLWNQGLPPMRFPRCMSTAVVLGHNIYVIGGYNYSKAESPVTLEHYNIRRQCWVESFSLGQGDFTNVDCCVLRIPNTNREFSNLGLAMTHKWVLW